MEELKGYAKALATVGSIFGAFIGMLVGIGKLGAWWGIFPGFFLGGVWGAISGVFALLVVVALFSGGAAFIGICLAVIELLSNTMKMAVRMWKKTTLKN